MKTATAQGKYIKISPRKVRLLAAVVRGKPLMEAEARLMVASQRSALPMLKVLRSAAANAAQAKLNPAALIVSEVRIDEGPKLRRFMPRARGGMGKIEKKSSHITIILTESGTAHPSRFVIARAKSEKAAKAEKKPHAPKKQEPEAEDKPHEKGASKKGKGVAPKIFSRKAI